MFLLYFQIYYVYPYGGVLIQCLHGYLFLQGSGMSSYKTHQLGRMVKLLKIGVQRVFFWAHVTDLDKKKQGPAVALILTGLKKQVALEFNLQELGVDDGLEKLLDKLRTSYGREESNRIFVAYVQFETINRGSRRILEYIQEFEQLNAELVKFKMILPTEVLVCKLLHCSSLELKDRQFTLSATPKLDYDSMKATLRRIYCSTTCTSQLEQVEMKPEPVVAAQSDPQENDESPVL